MKITISILIGVLLASVSNASVGYESMRFCGRMLFYALTVTCNTDVTYLSAEVQPIEHYILDNTSSKEIEENDIGIQSKQMKRQKRSFLLETCCYKACTLEELKQFC